MSRKKVVMVEVLASLLDKFDLADNCDDEDRASAASCQVLFSADILPIIFLHLRDLASKGGGQCETNMLVLPMLHVNKAFFDAGANLLWEKLDSLEPLFRLLPWFETLRESAQLPEGANAMDWDRFNLYASRVREFTLSRRQAEHPPVWVRDLGSLALQGMPSPIFPRLQSVKISPVDFMTPSTCSLFVSPLLKRLEIGLNDISQEGEPVRLLPHLALQATTSSVWNLQSLNYTGPTDEPFFLLLAKLTSLTSVTLYVKDRLDPRTFRNLRELPLLQHLEITSKKSNGVGGYHSMKGLAVHPHSSLVHLRSMKVTAKQYQQCLFIKTLSPKNLKTVNLSFLAANDPMPVHLCLGLVLQGNANLEDLDVRFLPEERGVNPEALPIQSRRHWPSVQEAYDALSSALQNSKNLRHVLVHQIPYGLAVPMSRALCGALLSMGASLTSLRMFAKLKMPQGPGGSTQLAPVTAFPGLTFLATTVWMECPNLQHLALHFDAHLVYHENLSEALQQCEERAARDATCKCCSTTTKFNDRSKKHRLCALEISSGTPFDVRVLQLPPGRKSRIASFIGSLFPNLRVLKAYGTWAPNIWEEVHELVQSYQTLQRAGFNRRRPCA